MGIFRINTEDNRGRLFGEREVNYPQHEDSLSCSVMQGDVTEDERQRVREQLEQYCGEDTEGMIWITEALRRLAG